MSTIITNENIRNFVKLYLNSKTELPLDLKGKNIGSWDVSLVTNMEELFKDMTNFNEQLNQWNVSNVTNMKYMFQHCIKFNQPLNNWNVSNVTNMAGMFYNCKKLKQPLNNWNVSNVTNLGGMFLNCKEYNEVLNQWTVENATNMAGMFYNCGMFNKPLNQWNVGNVTNMTKMFYNCNKFNQVLNQWNISKVRNMEDMFTNCPILEVNKPIKTLLNQPNPIQTRITNKNIHKLVNAYVNLKKNLPLDLKYKPIGRWDVRLVTNMKELFRDILDFNEPLNEWNVSNVTNMRGMFYGCQAFNQPLNKWNVSNVEDMVTMFYSCQGFNQPLNSWNVSKVEDMAGMFLDCRRFNQPLNSWNVSKVEDMSHMFHDCIDFDQQLNGWNVSNVTNMSAMFFQCVLFNQPLDKWNVSKVENMESMFQHCILFDQPLNKWDVSNVSNMEDMFTDCEILEENKPIFKEKRIEATQIDVITESIKIPKNTTAYDLMEMDDVLIETYLQTNDNIIFLQFNKIFLSNRTVLQNLLDINKPDNPVVYICNQIYEKLLITKDEVKSDTPYFNLSSIGMFGIVLASEMQYVATDNNHQIYVMSDTNTTAPTLVSYQIYQYPGSNVVSGNHCQKSSEIKIYDIKIGKLEYTGGSIKKQKLTKKRVRNIKKRNTKKGHYIKKRRTSVKN